MSPNAFRVLVFLLGLLPLLSCVGDPGKISVSMTYAGNAQDLAKDVRSFVFIVSYTDKDGNEALEAFPKSCFTNSSGDPTGPADCLERDCTEYDPRAESSFQLDIKFDVIPEGDSFSIQACGLAAPSGNSPEVLVVGQSTDIANADPASSDLDLQPLATGGSICDDIPIGFCE